MKKPQALFNMTMRSLVVACSICATGLIVTAQSGLKETVSLDDCIQYALEKNLEIRIARYMPQIARMTLSGDYGAYDPAFRTEYQQNFRASPGLAGIGEFVPPATETVTENYRLGVGGLLPTGFQYDIFANLNQQSGRAFNQAAGGLIDRPDFFAPSLGLTMSQPLLRNLWIDSARLAITLSKRNFDQSEMDLRFQVIQTATAVTVAYYDLIAAMENVRVQRTAMELATRAWNENTMRVQVGAMAPLEEKQAEAQVKRSEADLITARQQLAVAQNTLKRLIHDDFGGLDDMEFVPLDSLMAIPETFDKSDSWHKGLTLRPDLINAQTELEKQDIRVRFARNQFFPQLDLIGSYGLSGFNEGELSPALRQIEDRQYQNYSFGIRLNVPLTNRRARAELRNQKLQGERLLLNYKRLEQDVMVEIDNSIRAAQAALERVGATTAAREYAFQAWEAEKVKLEKGRSTTFVVLQLQRDLTAAESAEIQAKSDYNKALARLAQAEGYTLERLGIGIQIVD
jgi:outer membrane protein TolC